MQLQLRYWLLPSLLIVLALISIVTLRSVAEQFASQQLVFFAISAGVFWFVSRFSFQFIGQYRWLLYAGLVGLLALTLVVGTLTRNTRRWISVGGLFSVQASQLAAPTVGVSVAYFIQNRLKRTKKDTLSIQDTIKVGAIVAVPAALIVVAPDLGSTIFYLASVGIVFLLGSISNRLLTVSFASFLIVVLAAWLFLLQPYQKDRIYCFISPQLRPNCSTYNAEQSLIAVGSGQLFGRGLGQGVQSHLRFLPERQTDFIFASFAEEWGFIGSALLICIYAILVGYIIKIALSTDTVAGYYYCMMIATLIAFQSSIHIGMNMYLFPITGISLPFVSYGGSSLIGMTAAVGVVYGIGIRQKQASSSHFT